MIESVVGGTASQELVQITKFYFRFTVTAELPSQANEGPVLRKACLLSPIRGVQVEESFIPRHQTEPRFASERAIDFTQMSKSRSGVSPRFNETLLKPRAG